MKMKKSLFLGVMSLLTTQMAFADMSNCQNPTEITLEGNVKMKFCEVPAARGILVGSEHGSSHERPVIARNFNKFQIGQFEVTQLQYKTLLRSEPWKGKAYVQENNNNPAVYVTYTDAVRFASILSIIDPTADYRLPTEAEWEYAARAGSPDHYYWGNDFDPNFAFYYETTRETGYHGRDVTSCPTPFLNERRPGYCANDFGLMHMLGNVWELTQDVYKSSYENASTNGHQAASGAGSYRVVRGGSWYSFARSLRSAYRDIVKPDTRKFNLGFRLVRMPR